MGPKAGADCGLCVEFMNQALSILIKIAANIGIGGTCADLCGKLPNGLEAKVCDILCEIVGIEALVKALQEIDPDPIYVCEEIKFCEINPNAAANITALPFRRPADRRAPPLLSTSSSKSPTTLALASLFLRSSRRLALARRLAPAKFLSRRRRASTSSRASSRLSRACRRSSLRAPTLWSARSAKALAARSTPAPSCSAAATASSPSLSKLSFGQEC